MSAESLPPDIEALLQTERNAEPPSPEARARVRMRVQATIAGAAIGASSTALASKAGVAGKVVTGKLIVAFAMGAVTVGAAAVVLHRHAATPPVVVAPAHASPPIVTRVDPQLPAPLAPSDEPPKTSAPVVHHVDPTGVDPTRLEATHLREERALLAQAKDALAARDPNAALAALDKHSRRYPAGQLAEERECLRIRALVASGTDAAQAIADFKQRWPHSMFQPTSCARDGNE